MRHTKSSTAFPVKAGLTSLVDIGYAGDRGGVGKAPGVRSSSASRNGLRETGRLFWLKVGLRGEGSPWNEGDAARLRKGLFEDSGGASVDGKATRSVSQAALE